MGIQYIKASNGKTYPVDSNLSDDEAVEYVIKQIKGKESKPASQGDIVNKVAQDADLIRQGKNPINSQRGAPPESNGRMALDKFHDALRNLGAGAGNSLQNAAQGLKPILGMSNPNLLNAKSENNIDFDKMFGVKEKNEAIQKIPEIATSFIPGIGAGKALGKAPGLVKAAGLAAEQAGIQGGLGYLFNPESRVESAGKAGGIAGGSQLAIDSMISKHPIAKALKYLLPRAGGAFAGQKTAEFAGLPGWAQTAAGIGGAFAGNAGANAIPKLLRGAKNLHGKEYAEDVVKATEKMDPIELKQVMETAKRRGVNLTPAEITQDPVLLAKEAKAGVNKENVRLKHGLEEERKVTESQVNKKFKDEVYNPEKHDAIQKQAFDDAKHKRVPQDLLPVEHDDLYKRAIKFAKSNNELSAELAKYPGGSVGRYDVVRRALDKMIKSEPASTFNLVNARTSLSKALKDFSPEYRTAMDLSEKGKVFKTISALENQGKLIGEDFFKGMEDQKKFDSLVKHTRNVPGADEFLDDTRKLYQLRKSVDTTALAKKLTDTMLPTSKAEAGTFLAKLFNGKSDKAMIELMYDPEIMKKVHTIAGMTEPEKAMIEFSKVLSRKKAQDVARTK